MLNVYVGTAIFYIDKNESLNIKFSDETIIEAQKFSIQQKRAKTIGIKLGKCLSSNR